MTLEHDPSWLDRLQSDLPQNVQLEQISDDQYAARAVALDRKFDIIVIDCAANRYACALIAREMLNEGGFVIFDNSDWYPNSTAELRDQGLIQVDFPDFRPDHWYRCCTSIFMHPAFRPKPLNDRLPLPVLGGKDLTSVSWDSQSAVVQGS